jgi:hypothetical protein
VATNQGGNGGSENDAGTDESEKERVDRELIELLNELRVALPGVQTLFAFLLIVPFQQPFADVSDLERAVYVVALLGALASTVLLIAPSTYHRIRFRDGDKRWLLHAGNRLLVAGTACLAVAVAAATFLVVEYLYGSQIGNIVAVVAALFIVWFWFGLPLTRKALGRRSGPPEPP